MKERYFKIILCFFLLLIFCSEFSNAQNSEPISRKEMRQRSFVFWEGTDKEMTFLDFASYCAPIFWFSPDEPELRLAQGKGITIPTYFPFEKHSDSPVVYYQIREIVPKKNAVGRIFKKDYSDINNSVMDLSKINIIHIDYNHYYRYESGLGSHEHDTEQAQFKVLVRTFKENDTTKYMFVFLEATGKAHALDWYDNIFTLDSSSLETKLPFNILVEEGKHASCTDVNGDGYYTPGYDVNNRKNDAWGIRDVMRTGTLFSSSFQSYMQKFRKPEHRVFPPLPEDSKFRTENETYGVYARYNAIYQLRPMPSADEAKDDKLLQHDMESYSAKFWPELKKDNTGIFDFFSTEQVISSLGISYRYDNGKNGVSFTFPLLIVKNVETPIIGGWIVNRIYAQGSDLNTFGYNMLITPSASGFLDSYVSAGLEINKVGTPDSNQVLTYTYPVDFTMELGIKIRANVKYSPFKFLSVLSDFWGVRLGIKNVGFAKINELNYIIEIGAGVW